MKAIALPVGITAQTSEEQRNKITRATESIVAQLVEGGVRAEADLRFAAVWLLVLSEYTRHINELYEKLLSHEPDELLCVLADRRYKHDESNNFLKIPSYSFLSTRRS
ncbi:unnamed protein product, partial [Mesorhabditis spiculigera]